MMQDGTHPAYGDKIPTAPMQHPRARARSTSQQQDSAPRQHPSTRSRTSTRPRAQSYKQPSTLAESSSAVHSSASSVDGGNYGYNIQQVPAYQPRKDLQQHQVQSVSLELALSSIGAGGASDRKSSRFIPSVYLHN